MPLSLLLRCILSSNPDISFWHDVTVFSQGKIYVHAGCPISGRLSTLHSFDLSSKVWTALSSAPLPGRGGTALALLQKFKGVEGGVILRFGGQSPAFIPVFYTAT